MLAQLRRFRIMLLLGVYLLLSFVLLLGDRRDQPGRNALPGDVALQSSARVQGVASAAAGSVGSLWQRYLALVSVAEENEALRAELRQLQEERARLLGVMQENARLRAMVGFAQEHPEFELVAARVVGRDLSPYFRVLTLRVERPDPRIEPGMPVLSAAGVVGRVGEVSRRSATVLLAVDPRSSIDVLVQRNRARGILRGSGYENSYQADLAYLLRREEVREGDLVVTSGAADRFPSELVVGRIARIERQEHGLFQRVRVEPAVDFGRLEEVFILLGESGAAP